jgi:branched-chain amino acid transport system ATP-binding protein
MSVRVAFASTGIAVIVVDKNLDDLLALAERQAVMAKSEIVFDGTTEAPKVDAALIHHHLGA